MRNIKFRGYNEINKKMLNWNELLDTNLKNIFTMQKKGHRNNINAIHRATR